MSSTIIGQVTNLAVAPGQTDDIILTIQELNVVGTVSQPFALPPVGQVFWNGQSVSAMQLMGEYLNNTLELYVEATPDGAYSNRLSICTKFWNEPAS